MSVNDNESCILISTKKYYSDLFEAHGRNERALGWDKGRQEIRFKALTRCLESVNQLASFTILDFGCGFGDLFKYLKPKFPNLLYTGVDISDDFITSNNEEWQEHNNPPKFKLIESHLEIETTFDFIIASGTFNYKTDDINVDYEKYVGEVLRHLNKVTKRAISVDFMSPNVDYSLDVTHHQDLTRLVCNVINPGTSYIIDATYLPYEFAFTVFKGD